MIITKASAAITTAPDTLPCSAGTSSITVCISRPMVKKMKLSSRSSRVRQTARSVIRSSGRRYFGEPWPVTSPAVTAATRPDAPRCSAGR